MLNATKLIEQAKAKLARQEEAVKATKELIAILETARTK